MRTLITLVILFVCTTNTIAQTQVEDQEKDKKILRKLAVEKAIELQKELNLTIRASQILQKTIFDYSMKANKVLQSKLSAREKSKSLSNIIYFQNEELKKVLTVDQFYQYLNLQNVSVAGF